MPKPSTKELKSWAENYITLWNAGDKNGWAENWKSLVSGDFRMLDPVGTPEKRGFQECALDSYDLFQPHVRFKIAEGTLFICDNEVAWLLENHIKTKEEEIVGLSIETYRFEEDGSVTIRTYYRVPERTDDTLGDMFKVYLPENAQ